MGSSTRRQLILLLVLTSACCQPPAAHAVHQWGDCQPTRGLRLEHSPPQRVELPFCSQFRCSCCAEEHALALLRAARPVMEDEDLSAACKEGLLSAACQACDPEVGTRVKRSMCRSTCDTLFEACKEDFFAYDSSTGLVSSCTEQVSGLLVCSQLIELASSADEFCKAAGFGPVAKPGSDEPCFDGSPVGPEACPAGQQASGGSGTRKQTQSQQPHASKKPQRTKGSKAGKADLSSRLLALLPWKLKRRHRQQLAVAGDLLVGTLIASFMAWAVVAVLQRVMKPSTHRRLRSPSGPPPTNAREVLARAAEARRRAGVGAA